MVTRTYLLIKVFKEEEHADAFIEQGEMFCRTIGDFKKMDEEDGRGDRFEGVTGWYQPAQIKLNITIKDNDGVEKQSFPIEDLAGPLIIQNNGYDRLNLYCMYAAKIEFEETYKTEEERVDIVDKINEMLKKSGVLNNEALSLGEFAVVVYEVNPFIRRVLDAAKEKNFNCWNGLVGYYDPDMFHGSFNYIENIFRKRNIYEHQNEYRFAFGPRETEGPLVFHLGSLNGIAVKIPTREVNDTFQIELVEGRDPKCASNDSVNCPGKRGSQTANFEQQSSQ